MVTPKEMRDRGAAVDPRIQSRGSSARRFEAQFAQQNEFTEIAPNGAVLLIAQITESVNTSKKLVYRQRCEEHIYADDRGAIHVDTLKYFCRRSSRYRPGSGASHLFGTNLLLGDGTSFEERLLSRCEIMYGAGDGRNPARTIRNQAYAHVSVWLQIIGGDSIG